MKLSFFNLSLTLNFSCSACFFLFNFFSSASESIIPSKVKTDNDVNTIKAEFLLG